MQLGNYELAVIGESECIIVNYHYDTNKIAVRPIVCIPTSVFNEKYLSSLVDE